MKTIDLKDLKKLFEGVLKRLEEDKVLEINVDKDYYRLIPTSEWDNHTDTIFTGSLHDDVDGLKSIIQGEGRIFTYVDFDRLASILRFISEKENPVNG